VTPRKTKLVATIGPACESPEILEAMIEAGMNVARLNFSHGHAGEHRRRLEAVREAADRVGVKVAVMVDTRGIEIRTGVVREGAAVLERGEPFALHTGPEREGDVHGVHVDYAALAGALSPGARVLIDDGKIELAVERVKGGEIHCVVECGGTLRDRKGVNVPGTRIVRSALDVKGNEDLIFAADNDADYLAASFVQTAEDIVDLRRFVESRGADIPIIAKVENQTGVDNLEAIIDEANGAMVARGDLGVELPMQKVPSIQKRIIKLTVSNGKPVITATQMLDSMERNPRPTRAEVSDVANAIFDGTSAVMLSGETAAGEHPVGAVETMAALALEAEASLEEYGVLQHIHANPSNVVTEAVAQAAITVANHLKAAAIIALTDTGFTARSISKYRPRSPILAVTRSEPVSRKLAMNWGILPIHHDGPDDESRVDFALKKARFQGYVELGDIVVVTAGRLKQAGATDTIQVLKVE